MKYFIFLQLALLFSSCGKGQGNPDSTFERATPTEVRLNPVPLDRLITDIETGKIPNIHGIYLIRNDRLVTENYFKDFKSHELHYVASVTKSVASALLGIAIDQGYFGGDIHTVLEQKASDLFPEYAALSWRTVQRPNLN